MAILLIESPNALRWCLDCFQAAPLPRQSRAKWRGPGLRAAKQHAKRMTSFGDRASTATRLPPIGIDPSTPDGIVTPLRACGPAGGSVAKGMKKISYRGYRFPPEIIQQAI